MNILQLKTKQWGVHINKYMQNVLLNIGTHIVLQKKMRIIALRFGI